MDSSSGNEGDMSDGEDYCFYTYKGNDDAIRLDQQEELNQDHAANQEAEGQNHSGRSSPEMDYLEMDFDPGPSCELVRYLLYYEIKMDYNVSSSLAGYGR